MSLVFRCPFGVSFFGRRQHGGHEALWPNDEGGPLRRVPECARIKPVQLKVIAYRLRTGESNVPSLTQIPALMRALRQFGDFLVGVKFFGTETFRPFQWRQRIVGPYSFEVRLTIECAWRVPGFRDRRGFRRGRLRLPGGGLLRNECDERHCRQCHWSK